MRRSVLILLPIELESLMTATVALTAKSVVGILGSALASEYLGPVEQRSARHPVTVEVVGSNPIRLATFLEGWQSGLLQRFAKSWGNPSEVRILYLPPMSDPYAKVRP